MSAPSIEYVPCDPPKPLTIYGLFLFGGYRITYEDGFTVLIPHSGYVGTVSQDPSDLDDDGFRAALTCEGDRARVDYEARLVEGVAKVEAEKG